MKVELTGFSQGVSFTKKEETLHYLDFKTDEGKSFRLPVPEETLNTLIAEVYGEEKVAAPEAPEEMEEPEEDDLPEGATTFGEEEEGPEIDPDPEYPATEAEVPSL